MAESKGFFRRTPVHLRVASLLDHVGKNSPPDCFLPQTTSAPYLFESLYLFLPMQKAGVETCGLFIFVGTQASISVPPWKLNLIRPSVWTVTVSMTVNQSFSSNSVRMSSSYISNMKAPMASAWASRAAFVDRSCSSCALTFPVI